MGTRTISCSSETYTTKEAGAWVAFTPRSNNGAFGSNCTPTYYSISFDHNYLYANYKDNVTMKWDLDFKIGGSWYTVYSGSKTMKKTSSNFNSSGSLSSTVANAFKNGSITEIGVTQTGSRQIYGSSSGSATLTIDYNEVYPSLGNPGTPSITQNNNGTYRITWSAPSYSNGSGSPTYTVKYGSTTVVSNNTSRDHTLTIPSYGSSLTFTVTASYSGLTSSSSKSITFVKPAVNAPSNLKINSATSYTGRTAPLTWTAGSFSSYLTGTLAYEIYKGSTLVATTSAGATSYTIPESTTKGWGTSAVTLKIRGKGTGLSNTSQGSTLYSGYTSTVSYTYKGAFTAAPTNLKINNGTSYTGQTAPLSWTAATVSSGGTITYSIRKNGTEVATTTETSYTFAETTTKGWGTSAVKLTVVATSSGVDNSSASNEVSYTYSSSLTAPSNLTISTTTGSSATLSWTAATLSSGNTITYSIRKGGTEFATTTSTSYTIPEATAKSWGTTAVQLTVVATGDGKTSSASNAVSFTYKPPYKTVKYYDGSKWVECTVHYYNGSSFQQVDPYYYTSATAYTGTSHQ